ncbi:MAG: ATP-binding protein [Bacteroidota bacterium]
MMLSVIRYRKARAEHLRELLETELKVREETLAYVSEELHDDVGQLLSLSKIHAYQINEILPNESSSGELVQLISQSLEKIRNISHVLKKEGENHLDVIQILNEEKQKVEALGNYSVEIKTSLESVEIENFKIPMVHRIIQEAINNALKHAKADSIEFKIAHEGSKLKIAVKDNGSGFDTNIDKIEGIGISNMKERANLIGAELILNSTLGIGSSVEIIL